MLLENKLEAGRQHSGLRAWAECPPGDSHWEPLEPGCRQRHSSLASREPPLAPGYHSSSRPGRPASHAHGQYLAIRRSPGSSQKQRCSFSRAPHSTLTHLALWLTPTSLLVKLLSSLCLPHFPLPGKLHWDMPWHSPSQCPASFTVQERCVQAFFGGLLGPLQGAEV